MAHIFSDVNDTEFTLNGIPYDKIFIAVPVGSSAIKVVCAYESRIEIMPVTDISEITVDGNTYLTQASLIQVLKYVIFNNVNLIQYDDANFLGTFATYTDFITAHPTGNAGEYAFTLTNAAAEDGIFEYRWNPAAEEWQLEPTPVSVQKKPFFIEEIPASNKINLSNWEGNFYNSDATPSTANSFTTVVEVTGGFAKIIIDTTGKTAFPTITGTQSYGGTALQVAGADFEADQLFDMFVQSDGSKVTYFFAKRFV